MANQTQSLPLLHAFPDVAQQLGVSLRALRERARRREFTHVRIGRERYLTPDQLQAFIASTTVASKASDALATTRDRQQRRRARANRSGKTAA